MPSAATPSSVRSLRASGAPVQAGDAQDQRQRDEREHGLDEQRRGPGRRAAESVPASAGPTTSAALKLVVSSAFAGGSSSSGTSAGMKLVKPPKDSG